MVLLGGGDIERIDVAQNGDKCRAVVNLVMNFLVPKIMGNFSTI